jgi:hypothetical protein
MAARPLADAQIRRKREEGKRKGGGGGGGGGGGESGKLNIIFWLLSGEKQELTIDPAMVLTIGQLKKEFERLRRGILHLGDHDKQGRFFKPSGMWLQGGIWGIAAIRRNIFLFLLIFIRS